MHEIILLVSPKLGSRKKLPEILSRGWAGLAKEDCKSRIFVKEIAKNVPPAYFLLVIARKLIIEPTYSRTITNHLAGERTLCVMFPFINYF